MAHVRASIKMMERNAWMVKMHSLFYGGRKAALNSPLAWTEPAVLDQRATHDQTFSDKTTCMTCFTSCMECCLKPRPISMGFLYPAAPASSTI